MSFEYGHFGAGFDLSTVSAAALRFSDLVSTRGEPVSIVRLTEIGEDDYGQPQYSESSHTERVFREERGRERILRPGTMNRASVRLFMKPWAAVKEDGYEVEIDGERYHIASLVRTRAYLQLELERKAT